jgi:exosome complex component RRP46
MIATKERAYERVLSRITEKIVQSHMHPRTSIRITIQVVSDDGSILSVATNALLLALLDAGIPQTMSVAAVCCMIDVDGHLLLDPTTQEETLQVFQLMIVAISPSDTRLDITIPSLFCI